jgi:hypothetical protein
MGRKISLSAPFFLLAMLMGWVVFLSLEAYAMERRWPAQIDRKHERYEFQIGDLKLLVPARILQPAYWVKPPEDRNSLFFFVTFPGPYFQDSDEQTRCMNQMPLCDDIIRLSITKAARRSPAGEWANELPHLRRSTAGDIYGLEFFERGSVEARTRYPVVYFGTTMPNGTFVSGNCSGARAETSDWTAADLLRPPGGCSMRFYFGADVDIRFVIRAKQLPHLAEIQEFLAALTQSMVAEPGDK